MSLMSQLLRPLARHQAACFSPISRSMSSLPSVPASGVSLPAEDGEGMIRTALKSVTKLPND
jgi:hypothetical protein